MGQGRHLSILNVNAQNLRQRQPFLCRFWPKTEVSGHYLRCYCSDLHEICIDHVFWAKVFGYIWLGQAFEIIAISDVGRCSFEVLSTSTCYAVLGQKQQFPTIFSAVYAPIYLKFTSIMCFGSRKTPIDFGRKSSKFAPTAAIFMPFLAKIGGFRTLSPLLLLRFA